MKPEPRLRTGWRGCSPKNWRKKWLNWLSSSPDPSRRRQPSSTRFVLTFTTAGLSSRASCTHGDGGAAGTAWVTWCSDQSGAGLLLGCAKTGIVTATATTARGAIAPMIQRFIERSFHDLAIGSRHAARARDRAPPPGATRREGYPWKRSGG